MTLIDLFRDTPALFFGTVGFLGLFVGSFLNVVIHRLPIMMEREWREGLEELDAPLAEAASDAAAVSPAAGGGGALVGRPRTPRTGGRPSRPPTNRSTSPYPARAAPRAARRSPRCRTSPS